MSPYIEYQSQLSIRNSDKSVATVSNSNINEPLISSDTWHEWSEKFETSAKALGTMAALTAGRKGVIANVSNTATIVAGIATIAAEVSKKQEVLAKEKENIARERKAAERQMRESVDRGMREHNDRMSRGEYRDPPTRERMSEIGRIA